MTNAPQGPGWWQASDGNWYPPQQPVAQAPPSYRGAQPNQGIAVTTHSIGLNMRLLRPKIAVDGAETPGSWGRTVVPTGPGQHQVNVWLPYFLRSQGVGPAGSVVQVPTGGLAELEYRAPAWAYTPGSLGVAPQRHNGIGIAIAFDLALAAIGLLGAFGLHRPPLAILPIFFLAEAVVLLVQSSSQPKAAQPPGQQAASAANWYPDPNDPSLMRYFDGRNWTAQTAPRR